MVPTGAACPRTFIDATGAAPSLPTIPPPIPQAEIVRQLSDIQDFVLLQWNMLNVEYHVGKYKWDPVSGAFEIAKRGREKSETFLHQQGAIIENAGTDLLIGEEIEGKPAFDGFVHRHMKGRWRSFMERGNDPRGIEVGFLLKNDLPLATELRSNRRITWQDPESGKTMPLFSRDLPVLILRMPGDAKPLLIVVGTHYKSKRNRPGDRESRRLAKAQADGTIDVIQGLQREFGALAPIVFAGDTNGEFNREAEFARLKKALSLEDALDIANPRLSRWDRVTHTYHPRGDDTVYSQLDVVALVPAIRACVKSAEVVRFRGPDGRVLPLPETYEQRKRNPSDHFPVRVVLDWKCLLELWSRPR